MASIAQIRPRPEVEIVFSTLARTAVQRTSQSTLFVILRDDKLPEGAELVFEGPEEINALALDTKNADLVGLAFETFAPKKVIVHSQGERTIEEVLKVVKAKKVNVLAAPYATMEEDIKIVSFIKSLMTDKIQKGIIYVSGRTKDADCVGVVQLGNTDYVHKLGKFTAQEFSVGIAGAIAGCPTNRSLDNVIIPNLISVDEVEPALGMFILYNDDDGVRVVYALNSKTTFDSMWKKDTRKIKIVRGMFMVIDDIRNTFEKYWRGIYLNNYDNKKAFCSNVTKVYFKEITPNILSPDFENYIDVDYDSQLAYAITDGMDVDTMTTTQILKYNTGDDVYLSGEVRFADTMASLSLEIAM